MTYVAFRDSIQARLATSPAGLTWQELRTSLHLPYDRPCASWTRRLESEIGLTRAGKRARALIWRVAACSAVSPKSK